jgi:hypothetical protein
MTATTEVNSGNGHRPHSNTLLDKIYDALNRAQRAQGNTTPTVSVQQPSAKKAPALLTVEDFYSYMPMHQYICVPTLDIWPGASVNARLKLIADDSGNLIPATDWLDNYRPIEQMIWAPGKPMIINNQLITEGGWIARNGVNCFNRYRRPEMLAGDSTKATLWLEHVLKLYGPDDTGHIIRWLAHRVQKPQEKINHAIVLGGAQGIGKDTILEPVKTAIGPWNFCEISPAHLIGRFNGFVKSVILRISEASDLGEINRYKFYEHLKTYTAAPPDVLRCDEKNIKEYAVLNICGVIITTNYKTNGMYLPPDDRRHFIAWSDRTRNEFSPEYWNKLYQWYDQGGRGHVCAYLRTQDISSFDAKMPPPQTEAFYAIVNANRAPEDNELGDAIDALGRPDALTLSDVITHAGTPLSDWLLDRRNARQIPSRIESVGYESLRNKSVTDGRWVIHGKRQVVYVRRDLSVPKRHDAVAKLQAQR